MSNTVTSVAVALTGTATTSNVITITVGGTPDTFTRTNAGETLNASLTTLATSINTGAQTLGYRYVASVLGNTLQLSGWAPGALPPVINVTATGTWAAQVYNLPGVDISPAQTP